LTQLSTEQTKLLDDLIGAVTDTTTNPYDNSTITFSARLANKYGVTGTPSLLQVTAGQHVRVTNLSSFVGFRSQTLSAQDSSTFNSAFSSVATLATAIS
jgi:hypothetical protein